MIYEWQCKKCGKVVEVQRTVAEYKVPPTEPGHDWEKIISRTSTPFEHLRNAGIFADEHGNMAY